MGLFWGKKDAAPSAPATPPSGVMEVRPPAAPATDSELDAAVESVAAMLRAFGTSSFDTDELGAASLAGACESWAQHLLVFTDPPDFSADRASPKKRLWRGLVRFFAQRRKAEQRYVVESQATLREAVWAFVRAMSRVLAADRGADECVAAQLSRLKVAAEAPSPDELRREVGAAIDAIEKVVSERQERASLHATELAMRVKSLSVELEDAKKQAAVDALTKVANRKAFDEHAPRVADMASVVGTEAALLMIDIDHFKAINDAHGHPAGDLVLRSVADAIARTCKRRGDLVSRYGGEEFAVLLSDTSLADACSLAARVQSAVRAVRVGEGEQARPVTVSIGVAALARGEGASEWIARADKALYRAKGTGRDRVERG